MRTTTSGRWRSHKRLRLQLKLRGRAEDRAVGSEKDRVATRTGEKVGAQSIDADELRRLAATIVPRG